MILKGLEHPVELPVPELLHLVVPSGQVQPCLLRLGLPVEDVDQLQEDVISLLQSWELPEEDFRPPLLLPVPLRLVFEYDVPAACHDLRHGLPVLHPLRLPCADEFPLLLCPCRPACLPVLADGLVLSVEHLPPVAEPHLVDCLRDELLDVEAVVDEPCLRKRGAHGEHHGRGQVGGHVGHLKALPKRDLPEHRGDRVGGHAADHRHQCAGAAVGGLVRQYGVDLAVTQACLVKAQRGTYVVGEQDVALGVAELLPRTVVTDDLLVLLAKSLAVQPITGGKCGDAYGGGLNLPLLKKRRTQRSAASRRTRTGPSRS